MKVLTPDEVGAIVGVSAATLERYRNEGAGPNFLRIGPGGLIKYLESDVEEWLMSCRQLPPIDGSRASSPGALQAALREGNAERRAAMRERAAALKAIDDKPMDGVTALTVTNVGATPGEQMQRIDLSAQARALPPHTTQVAVAPAQPGRVPVPRQEGQ